MRSLALTRVLAATALLAGALVPTLAYAAGPAGPETIRVVDFEESGTTMTTIEPDLSVTTEPTNAYWGPTTSAFRSGARSLWCAGTLHPGSVPSTSWPYYPLYTRGITSLWVPELGDYYSSALSFWYLMPTLGDNDGTAFNFSFSGTDGSGNPVGTDYYTTDVERVQAWTQLAFDWTKGYSTQISRVPARFTLRFHQQGGGSPDQVSDGKGPCIDDIEIAGYRYGPVSGLTGTNTGTEANPVVELTWAKPSSSIVNSAADVRDMSYRVWRLDTGANTWTELTSGARVNSPAHSLTDSTAAANHSYRYFVQAWDPSGGISHWGEVAPPVDVAFVADKTTSTTGSFRDFGNGPASLTYGAAAVLQVEVASNATGAGIPGMLQSDFAVRQSASGSMAGATTATIVDFTADEDHAGRYYLTVSPPVGTTYYRVDYLGSATGFDASPGAPVLRADVAGNTTFVTTAKPPAVVSYGGRTTVSGALSMGGVPLGAEGDHVSLQAWTAAGWSNVAAAITDAGNGVYSAVTPAVTSATSFRLHFAGDGGATASTDVGKVDVVPYASLSVPSGKSTARYRKYYTVTGTLRPGHAGAPVRIEGYQKVRGKYKKRWTKSAANSNYGSYSKYTFKVKLGKGSWRLYAVHADSSHATTRTRYKAVTCR